MGSNIKAIYRDYQKNRKKYWQQQGRSYMKAKHKASSKGKMG